jgi:hypothetical protein
MIDGYNNLATKSVSVIICKSNSNNNNIPSVSIETPMVPNEISNKRIGKQDEKKTYKKKKKEKEKLEVLPQRQLVNAFTILNRSGLGDYEDWRKEYSSSFYNSANIKQDVDKIIEIFGNTIKFNERLASFFIVNSTYFTVTMEESLDNLGKVLEKVLTSILKQKEFKMIQCYILYRTYTNIVINQKENSKKILSSIAEKIGLQLATAEKNIDLGEKMHILFSYLPFPVNIMVLFNSTYGLVNILRDYTAITGKSPDKVFNFIDR